MIWALLVLLVVGLGISVMSLKARREELLSAHTSLEEREKARAKGTYKARLQYPVPDLARCIGCGTCIAACPEEGVLELVHGQAIVVHGARCVGHGVCAAECPVGAIALTLGDITERRDLPALSTSFEAVGTPGLFLAGEVTGFALIRTAISHGVVVATEVARQVAESRTAPEPDRHDLIIIGAGPAGISCALEAKRRGLRALIIEQDILGGTVAHYPKRKLVLTQPVDLPLHGRLKRTTYRKEELIDIWRQVVEEQEIQVLTECEFKGTDRTPEGDFLVYTSQGTLRASAVCLAVGRRGTPRKLGVAGEDTPKVAYSLIDAQAFTSRNILVVGGGDSAIEAALGLAEQEGNHVTLSYRKGAFNRLKARNEVRISSAIEQGRVTCLYESEVQGIEEGSVKLQVKQEGISSSMQLQNDDVFVFAGGLPPFPLLERCGVSLDPADMPPPESLTDGGTSFLKVLALAFCVALVALLWTLGFRSYYSLPGPDRLDANMHDILRPGSGLGLFLGFSAALLITANLAYLIRRSAFIPFRWGSLQKWMSSHVLTGILAVLAAIAHSAMMPKNTVGGHALLCLAVLIVTGAIGRYFYSFVPHAANGQELKLDEVRANLANVSGEWDRGQHDFAKSVRLEIDALVRESQWETGFFRRVLLLVTGQRRLRKVLRKMERNAHEEGLSSDHVIAVLELARRAHRGALMAAHYEDLRGLVNSWRYFHRWIALMMVGLVAVHVFTALQYGQLFGNGE